MDGDRSDNSTFGTCEVEVTAGHLLTFFKSRGYWCSFTIDDLIRYYADRNWNHNTMFYGLIGGYLHFSGPFVEILARREPMLVADQNGKYYVTNMFIEQCCLNLKKVA
jgi:hypothetical protein